MPTQCTTLIGMACRTFDFIFNLKRRQLLKFKVRGLKNLRDLDAVRVGQTPAFFYLPDSNFFYLSTAVLTLVAMTHSSPQAERQGTKISISFSMAFLISSPTVSSGHLRSSLVSPLSSMRERKSSSIPISWKSLRFTLGTSMLCVEGQISSSFLPVKMSRATR